jgi:hypothetical protein
VIEAGAGHTAHIRDGRRVLVVVDIGTDVSDDAVDRRADRFPPGWSTAVLLAGASAGLLAGAALRPMQRMRHEAANISDRDTGRHLAVPSTRDEIAALGATINGLLAGYRGAGAGARICRRCRSRAADPTGDLAR